MIPWFSRIVDYHVERQFRRDPSGRAVFLPFGRKGKAYSVDSKSDEEKIKAFLKMYRSAAILLSWMSYPGIYGAGLLLNYSGGAIPLRNKLETVGGIAALFLLILIALSLMLWGVYKQAIPGLTSSLSEVAPELKDHLSEVSPRPRGLQRLAVLCLAAGIVLMGGAILATSRSRGKRRSPSAVCAPTTPQQ
jgi:hypothetical protein